MQNNTKYTSFYADFPMQYYADNTDCIPQATIGRIYADFS